MTTPTLERDEEMITSLSRSFPRKQPLIALAILLVCILIGMFAVENSVKFYLYRIAGLCLGYVLVRGAFVFGMGAIMAGACASGCLTDIGEGYVRAMIALVTFILFSVPGEMARAALDATPLGASITVHLPDWFGYPGAILVSLIGFFVIYAMVWGYERKRKRESTVERVETPKELLPIPGDTDGRTDKFFGYRLWHNLFNTRWTFMTSAMMLTFLWIFILVTTHKAWGVTSAFTTWSVGFLRMLGIEFSADWAQSANAAIDGGLLNDGGTVRNLALLIGAAYALLLAGRFRFNTDFNVRDVTIYATGGALMGFGARMADGCNIGALFSGLSVGSLSGWVFGVFLVLGAAVGLKLFEGRLNIIPPSRHLKLKETKLPDHRITDR